MPASLTVTPGVTVASGDNVDAALLNQIANPQVSVADASIGIAQLKQAEVVAALAQEVRAVNYLPWGNFQPLQFLSTSMEVLAGTKRENAPGWFLRITGTAGIHALYERSSDHPSNNLSSHSAKVIGATGLTLAELGTYLPPDLTGQLTGDITISCWMYNGTGAALVPKLVICTSNALGSSGDCTERSAVDAAASIPNATWGQSTWTIAASALTNWGNGAELLFRFAAAALNSTAKFILLSQVPIWRGASNLTYAPPLVELSPMPSGIILPWAGPSTLVPNQWLLCHGQAVSRVAYSNLFSLIGTAYGVGDGSTTFNLPDLRGRNICGVDVDSNHVQSTIASCATTAASADNTVTSIAGIQVGMGVFGQPDNATGGIANGTTVIAMTGLTVTLSAPCTLTGSRTLRFSKLGGAGDPNIVGALANGAEAGVREVVYFQKSCSTTNGLVTMTVPTLENLRIGMGVQGTGIATGTTIAAFLSATSIQLSLAATATGSPGLVTYTTPDSEGDPWRARDISSERPAIGSCAWTNADSFLDVPYTTPLKVGMLVEGHASIPANTYVVAVGAGGVNSVQISNPTTGLATGQILTFSFGAPTRLTPLSPKAAASVFMHHIIKI